MCFSPYLGLGRALTGWGGVATKGLVHNLQFSPLAAQKSKFLKIFFDTVITQHYHPRYVKHVWGCIYQCFCAPD